jgi:hypothetical protein
LGRAFRCDGDCHGSALACGARKADPIISHIAHQNVESTAIAAVGYSKRRHILEIKFINGPVYRYLDVSPAVLRADVRRFEGAILRQEYQGQLSLVACPDAPKRTVRELTPRSFVS